MNEISLPQSSRAAFSRATAMAAGEISDYDWNGLSLTMGIDLVGGFPMTQHFHIPDGMRLGGIRCIGADCSQTLQDGHLALTLTSRKSVKVRLELSFQ